MIFNLPITHVGVGYMEENIITIVVSLYIPRYDVCLKFSFPCSFVGLQKLT